MKVRELAFPSTRAFIPFTHHRRRGLRGRAQAGVVYRVEPGAPADHLGGFGHLLLRGQAGFLDHEKTVKGKTLVMREVYSRLKELPESG
jgi:hypothetical protein